MKEWAKKLAAAIRGNEDFSDIKSSTVRDFMNGNFLTKRFFQKQYGLLILLAILAFIYVDNRYYCETQLIREIELKKKIQDAKYESLTISAQLMQISRQSNVQKMIKERNLPLVESNTPPVVIDFAAENDINKTDE
jgi:hypothetical protein